MNTEPSAMDMYCADIKQIPRIPEDEERELFLRFRDGDTEAKKRLVEGHLRLSLSVAKKYSGRGVPLEDLVQEGNMGLMRAVENFDPDAGYKFSTFAMYYIKSRITRFLRTKRNLISIPSNIGDKVPKIFSTSGTFFMEHGRDPTEAELAEILGMKADEVAGVLVSESDMLSMETPLDAESDFSLMDTLEDTSAFCADSFVYEQALHEALEKVLGTLTEAEREMAALRFGLDGTAQVTLQEAADILGITKEKARVLETMVIRKLRHPKNRMLLKDFINWKQLRDYTLPGYFFGKS